MNIFTACEFVPRPDTAPKSPDLAPDLQQRAEQLHAVLRSEGYYLEAAECIGVLASVQQWVNDRAAEWDAESPKVQAFAKYQRRLAGAKSLDARVEIAYRFRSRVRRHVAIKHPHLLHGMSPKLQKALRYVPASVRAMNAPIRMTGDEAADRFCVAS